MPAQKRKHRPLNGEPPSTTNVPPARRNQRRSPVPLVDSSSHSKGQQQQQQDDNARRKQQHQQQQKLTESKNGPEFDIDFMHTITHHTSFLPTMSCLHSSASSSSAYKETAFGGMHNNGSSSTTAPRPHALYHPRNLGMMPHVVTETRQEGKKDSISSILDCQKHLIPHSAGCRMKFLPSPSFRPLPVHPDYHRRHVRNGNSSGQDGEDLVSMEGLTCPTVMNHSDDSSSGQVAVGDTGGYVTLYATVPDFLSVATLESSASKRFWNMISKTKSKRKKRIGRSQAIVGSSIDRSNAIEVIVLLPKKQRVVVGTRLEVECISFENEIQWTWSGSDDGVEDDDHYASWQWIGWDGLSRTKMARGHPTRLHGSWDDVFVLASYGFFPLKQEDDVKQEDDIDNEKGNEQQQKQNQQEDKDGKHQRPELFSPILKFNVDNGKISNVVPFEPVTQRSEHGSEQHSSLESNVEWVECPIGSRAMAIFDQLQWGNIVGVFLTLGSSSDTLLSESSATSDCLMRQELMVLDSYHRIIHRTTIPSKSSGAKLITVEAINQSPHGDFTIAANAKGGIRLYRTDGLQLLGVYGEGVSLHGHSIFWQDIFFTRHDSGKMKYGHKNDESFEAEQEQWGNILERRDELAHRNKYESFRRKKYGANDELNELYIVSVPNAFREPYDMKEHIQVWDVSTAEFDGGNKLPSFELLAPKKSEGICTLIYDDSYMTSNSGRFLMSTHAGDCLELSSTMVTDWAGQMYPTGFLVIDNNITYIEDEDELDQVVDSHIDQVYLCQNINSTTALDSSQNEKELKLVLQMSMQDEPVDVIGGDEDEWRKTVINVAPCRPKPHLKSSYATGKEEEDHHGTEQHEGSAGPQNAFALMKTLPTYAAAREGFLQYKENQKRRQSLIEETKLKMQDSTVSSLPRRKQGNIEYIINNSVDKQLMIKMLENMSYADGSGSSLRGEFSAKETEDVSSMDQTQSRSDSKKKILCPACEGRYVIHICGIRATPIDYDAIAEAEREKQEKEEAEKKRLLQEKRKAAEQKRKEKKLKKLREEQKNLQNTAKEKEETVEYSKQGEAEINTQKQNDIINRHDFSTELGKLKTDEMGDEWPTSHQRLHDTSADILENGDMNHDDDEEVRHKHQEMLTMEPFGATEYFSKMDRKGESTDDKHDVDFKLSLGSISFGDSLLSNIPTLPSEDLNDDNF